MESPTTEDEAPDRGQFAYEEAAPGDAEAPDRGSQTGEDDADGDRTPMGNRRRAVTESDEIDYKLPAPTAAQARARAIQAPTCGTARRSQRRSWRRSTTSASRRKLSEWSADLT